MGVTAGMDDEAQAATVVAAWGRRVAIELAGGERVQARLKGKRLQAVCGDRVEAAPLGEERDWLVTAVEPRENALERLDGRGRREIVAANLDALLATIAPEPAPDFFVVDRYLCAAELMGIAAAIAMNKADLGAHAPHALEDYPPLGYPVLECSAVTGAGLDAVRAELDRRLTLIVGQSGAGKSSLVNALAPDAGQRVRAISAARGEGRHTTVAAELIRVPGNGAVIDTPGVRDYAPWLDDPRRVGPGFREIARHAEECRFADCLHRAEPDCAVQAAVAAGDIAERRYTSYRRLLNLTLKFRERQH